MSRASLGPSQLPIQCGYRVSFSGVMWMVHECYHSLTSSAELRVTRAMLLLSLYDYMAWTQTVVPFMEESS
jgi:hypothetical protein